MTEQELEKLIKTGNFLPVYFFYGDEPFLVERAGRRVMEQAVDPTMKDFNLNIYYGADCKGTEILDTSQTLPMFSERRVVVVRQADKLPAATQEGLVPYLANPCSETCLIFLAAKPDLRRKFFMELKKQPGTLEFKKLYDNKLGPFIAAEAQIQGKRIDGAGAEMLAFMVGNNLQELVSQIEKAALYKITCRSWFPRLKKQPCISVTVQPSGWRMSRRLSVRARPLPPLNWPVLWGRKICPRRCPPCNPCCRMAKSRL